MDIFSKDTQKLLKIINDKQNQIYKLIKHTICQIIEKFFI